MHTHVCTIVGVHVSLHACAYVCQFSHLSTSTCSVLCTNPFFHTCTNSQVYVYTRIHAQLCASVHACEPSQEINATVSDDGRHCRCLLVSSVFLSFPLSA